MGSVDVSIEKAGSAALSAARQSTQDIVAGGGEGLASSVDRCGPSRRRYPHHRDGNYRRCRCIRRQQVRRGRTSKPASQPRSKTMDPACSVLAALTSAAQSPSRCPRRCAGCRRGRRFESVQLSVLTRARRATRSPVRQLRKVAPGRWTRRCTQAARPPDRSTWYAESVKVFDNPTFRQSEYAVGRLRRRVSSSSTPSLTMPSKRKSPGDGSSA